MSGYAPLVAVEVEKQAAALRPGLVVQKGADAPRTVAYDGPLDLDYVRAEAGEYPGAIGSSDVVGEVEDFDSGKRRRGHR